MSDWNFLKSVLACPNCKGALTLEEEKSSLSCGCGRSYFFDPKLGYIDFIDNSIESAKSAAQTDWDAHWKNVKNKDSEMASEEVEYLENLAPGLIDRSIILDVGSGTGRYLRKFLSKNPAVIFLTDISTSIYTAAENYNSFLKDYPSTQVYFLRCNFFHLPFSDKISERTGLPSVYTCCGVLNLLENQKLLIQEAQRVANSIFILYNSPKSSLGRIYYRLSPIRSFVGRFSLSRRTINFLSLLFALLGYPFVRLLITLKLGHSAAEKLKFNSLRFLIEDWIFCNPQSFLYPDEFYFEAASNDFKCELQEKPISRVIYYRSQSVSVG